ncbi:unnamed protein product [Adineta ricciae]|uniref:Uncharacterized protein n=1 Tax=Adineta ricciae TaxID=249248 RepID=A0A815QAJ8_ADIRI|nr:unnamed protein product [Adineta ricciae]
MQASIRLVSIVVSVLYGASLVLYAVSNGLPDWFWAIAEGITIATGLWRTCVTSVGTTVCGDFKCVSGSDTAGACERVMAGRAFMTLACILSGICTIAFFIFGAMKDRHHRLLLLFFKVLGFVCLVMGSIGVGVGGSILQVLNEKADVFRLGAAAILGIIAVAFNLVAAVAALFAKASPTGIQYEQS